MKVGARSAGQMNLKFRLRFACLIGFPLFLIFFGLSAPSFKKLKNVEEVE